MVKQTNILAFSLVSQSHSDINILNDSKPYQKHSKNEDGICKQAFQ